MSKPSIGDAVTLAAQKDKKREIQELTVLENDSRESIYHLIFNNTEKGGVISDGQ